MMQRPWICCQLGAREHYAVPRALASVGLLRTLITDVWVPPGSFWRLPQLSFVDKLRERYHPALKNLTVNRFNGDFLRFELTHRLRRTGGWERIMARNRLFAWRALHRLKQIKSDDPMVLFTYSYVGLDMLRWAKAQGWRTVLGQIDPGPAHYDIVGQEMATEQKYGEPWNAPPAAYWEAWREECMLADTIVVNSAWSREALARTAIPAKKLKVVPLAYEAPDVLSPPKEYPARFSAERPLRVLFLGQINLVKGVARLLQAAQEMSGEAIEFWMVGPMHIRNQSAANRSAQVRWIGPVSRGQTTDFYRAADVFILPTLSDGFALTQLEALAHRLPVIASANCGQVVRDGVNGRILPSPNAEAIVAALRECLREPAQLGAWSKAAIVESEFTLASLARSMEA